MIDTIKILLEQGISLVREGRDQRKTFFVEIAQPIHSKFILMQMDHASTFQYVSRSLANPSVNLRKIINEVSLRHSFESHQWIFIYKFRNYEIPRRELEEEFSNYMNALCECLGTILPKPSIGLVFYDNLLNVLTESPRIWEETNPVGISHRDKTAMYVDELHARFNHYSAEVEAKFLALKSKALL